MKLKLDDTLAPSWEASRASLVSTYKPVCPECYGRKVKCTGCNVKANLWYCEGCGHRFSTER